MAIGSYKKSQLERGTGFPLGAYVLDKNRVQFSISLLDDYDCKLHICWDEGGEWVDRKSVV